MLVLSRKLYRKNGHPVESIIILCADGTRIEVKPIQIEGDTVKLGIDAPDSGPKRVLIFRNELEKEFAKHRTKDVGHPAAPTALTPNPRE